MKFKVGDRVRIVAGPVSPHKIGDVGEVIRYSEGCLPRVRVGDYDWSYCEHEIIPIVAQGTKPTDQIRHILSRHISNKKKMELIAEVVASNQT